MGKYFRGLGFVLILIISVIITGCSHQTVSSSAELTATMTPFQPQVPASATPTTTPPPTPTPLPTEETETPEEHPQFAPQELGPGEVTVPILLYHHVSDTLQTQYSVTTSALDEQMNWLYQNGYQTITVTELAHLIREGGTAPGRPVIITFDDGWLDLYENAYPILRKYGFQGTAYIVANAVNAQGNLSAEQLKELIDQGWEIGSHGLNHIDLTKSDGWQEEITASKAYLEKVLGIEILTFAYPYGVADIGVMNYTFSAGYTSAVGLGSTATHSRSTLYYLSRMEVKSWHGLVFLEEIMPWSEKKGSPVSESP